MGTKPLHILFVLWTFWGILLYVSAASSQRALFDDKCQCKCECCPAGQRWCPTSNECIDEFKWCNGVQDCPDDEQGCDQTPISGDGDVCRLLSNATACIVEGRFVKTFDGKNFTHDVCGHILFQDKAAKQFSVTVYRRCSRVGDFDACESSVSIKCNSTFVKLGPTLSDVSVNGISVDVRNLGAISRRLGDVHLSRNGQRLVFTSVKHNFEVAFDERRAIKISVSDCLSSKTNGLCGLYDWDAKNDFRTPDDRLVSDAWAFANSWTTPGTTSSNCDMPTCPKETREKAERWCQKIASPPLSLCLEDKGQLETSVERCADVVCDCLTSSGGDDEMCLCNAIEGFVSKCKTAVRSQIESDWMLSLGCVPMDKCVYTHRYNVVNGLQVLLQYGKRYKKMYPVGSSWMDGLCTNCTCSKNFNQYQYSCNVEVCSGQQKDNEDYVYAVSPSNYGVCCPEQRRTACRNNGQTYYVGSEWRQPEDGKCRSYRCEESPSTGKVIKVVLTQICNKTCHPSERYVEPAPGSGDCCGRCVRVFCEENGSLYLVGERWVSTVRPCFQVQCVRNDAGVVETKYTLKACPKLPPNCPKNNIVRDETGCCQKCQVAPGSCAPHTLEPSRTMQYFTLYDPENGLCYNTEPIANLAECRGQCFSRTVFNPETNNFTSNCRCCTITKAIPAKVSLSCENGRRVQKDYQSPVECGCTTCGGQRTTSTDLSVPIPV